SSIATEKSPVESREHQDNANIHCQPFPEVVSKEREIHTDYDGYHHHHVNHYSYLSARFSHAGADSSVLQTFGDPAPRGKLKIPWEISREGSSLSVRTKIFSVRSRPTLFRPEVHQSEKFAMLAAKSIIGC
ncbi:MAG: hypothetical protein WAN49_07750, partial [Pseudolabrys sp.]